MRGILHGLVIVCVASSVAVGATPDPAALAAAQRAVEASPGAPAGYETLARLQLKAGDAAGAVETCQRLVEAVPDYHRGRYRLAFALRKAGRFDGAAAAYRAYIEVAGDDPDGHFGLGRTLEKLGDSPGALVAYQRYVELETRPGEARWVQDARGRIEALKSATPTAATPSPAPASPPAAPETTPPGGAAASRAERGGDQEGPTVTDANAPPPASPSGEAAAASPGPPTKPAPTPQPVVEAADDPVEAFARGAYASAEAGFARQLEARPDDPQLHYRRAVSATMAGAFTTAEAHASATVRLDPGNPSASDAARIARAYITRSVEARRVARAEVERAVRDGRARTALRLADQAIRQADDAAEQAALHRLRGRALLALDRVDAAFDALKSAAALRPPATDLWIELATVAQRRGDREAAQTFTRMARLVAPPEHPIMNTLGGAPRSVAEDR